MTHVGLLLAGFTGMLVFWSLALWFWTTAARGAWPAEGTEGDRSNAPTTIDSLPASQRTSSIPMQFRRLQSGAMALLAMPRRGQGIANDRVRRDCMFVNTSEAGVESTLIPEVESDDEREIERRATGIFSAEADSPRRRDAHAAQELATQPYTRARHRISPVIGEGDDVR